VVRLPTEPLVGREQELRLAQQLMLDVQQGRAATIVVDGEAGVGKTSLIQALMSSARADGMRTADGAAHPFETTRPFGALAAALDLRSTSDDPRRASIGELLAGDQPGDTSMSAGADLRYRVVDAVVDLVENECSPVPLLLVLEDVHWADTSTLLAVRSMARELVHVPLLLAISMRPSPRSGELKQLLDDLLEVGARSISLDPLSSPEIDALMRAELGVPPGPELAAIVAKAGGNPLWAVEILRSLSADGRLQRESEVSEVIGQELPDSLRELVLRRLRDLPQETLDLLQVVAVLGDAVTIGDLATVTRRPAVDLVPALGEAFRSRLLGEEADTVVFRHQLVHDAIYQSTPQPVRSALHRDAAGALADAGADLSQVASHLVLGAGPGDLDAVRWLREAARDAATRAPAEAVELLRCAQSLLPHGHADIDVIEAEIIEALLLAGNVAEATEHARILLDRPHRPDVDTPVRLWLLETLSLQNLGPELIDRAEATLEKAHDLSDAQHSLVLAQSSYGRTFSGDFVGGEATARRALDHAERADDVAMTVWSLGTLSLPVKTQGRYAEALMLSRRAVDLAFDPPNDAARLRHPYFFLGMSLSDSDLLDEARVAFRRAVDECSALGSSWLLPDALLLSAEQRFIVGEWDDAWSELEAGLRVANERGHKISIPQTRASEAIMAMARGDHRQAEVALATVRSHLVSDVAEYGVEMVAFATSLLAEAEGQATKAQQLLVQFWQLDEQRENRYYHRYLAPLLVRLSLLLDQDDIAHTVTEGVEAGAALAPDVPSVQSTALRCRGLVDQDPDRMIRAVELARPTGRLLDHTSACEDAASVCVSAGRTDEAISLWTEALGRYEDIGANGWAMRVLERLRQSGVRHGARGPRQRPATGWESLTPTEHAVSGLVAEGLTNREIARRLHVSPHTVNTHLRHIFQKLSVPSRAALAAEVARHGPDHAIE
jgi:DNA-binding CsgD family transcriptional regulator